VGRESKETYSLVSTIDDCLVAYGSEWSVAFKPRPNREETAIAVGVYKLAVRISIGSFFGAMFGVIAMLGAMAGGSGGMDIGALTGGLAFSLITILYVYTGWYSPSPYFYPCNTTSNTNWTRILNVQGGVVQDGHGEKVQESLKQVHYDY